MRRSGCTEAEQLRFICFFISRLPVMFVLLKGCTHINVFLTSDDFW